MDIWDDDGGFQPEDDEFETDKDREPRNPKKPDLQGGAMLPIPIEEEELTCV